MERLNYVVPINTILGAWLIIAPFAMAYSGSTVELVIDVGVGVWLIGCSWWILASGSGQAAAGTLELLASIGLVAAPFVLHYQRMSRPFDNDIGIGILAFIVSATAMWMLGSKLRTLA